MVQEEDASKRSAQVRKASLRELGSFGPGDSRSDETRAWVLRQRAHEHPQGRSVDSGVRIEEENVGSRACRPPCVTPCGKTPVLAESDQLDIETRQRRQARVSRCVVDDKDANLVEHGQRS